MKKIFINKKTKMKKDEVIIEIEENDWFWGKIISFISGCIIGYLLFYYYGVTLL